MARAMNARRLDAARSRAARAAALALASCLSLCGCGDADVAAGRAAAAAAQAALAARQPESALQTAQSAIARHGAGPELQLALSMALLQLDRRGEAIAAAQAGLELAAADDGLRADLEWARGAACMGRYTELKDEADWREANIALERATRAGSHRAEAAFMLVALQDLGAHADLERQRRFARLVLELDGEGKLAAAVRSHLAARGVEF